MTQQLLANLKTFIRQVIPEFKVTTWSQEPSDDKMPSEKLIKNALDSKADSQHFHNQYLTALEVDERIEAYIDALKQEYEENK